MKTKNLFLTIDSTIRKERLYANKDLMRENIMQRFGIGRHHLNRLLNTNAQGMTFPQYINDIRMEKADELITHHPEMTIAEIACEVGFTPANLREQFKRRYGITPSEYRENYHELNELHEFFSTTDCIDYSDSFIGFQQQSG